MYGRKLTRRKTTRHRSKTTRHRRKTTRHRKNIRGGVTPLKPIDPNSEGFFGFEPSRSPPKYGFSPYVSWHNKKLHNINPTPPKHKKKNRKPVKGKLNSPLPQQNPTPPKHKRTTAQKHMTLYNNQNQDIQL
jgi:hypothetical protein